MTKAELKNGMGVVHRNGEVGFVIRDCHTGSLDTQDLIVYPSGGFNRLRDFDDDLIECVFHDKDYDIMKVVEFTRSNDMLKVNVELATVLWERKEKKSLTLEEIEELLGYPVEIVTTTPPTDEPTDKPKYKVGDKVVVTNNAYFAKGSIATIVTIEKWHDDDYQPYKCEQNDDSYWLSDNDIEPYKEV